jgi:anti-sigma regulatory factor (Ser/Thr protein kinase)
MTSGHAVHATLPVSLRAPRQARQAIRNVLRSWGLANLSNDAELIASEIVANAAEHVEGSVIGMTIRQHTESSGQRGILCQITDADPSPPGQQQPARPDCERGRGLQIVRALATNSGFTSTAHGKTAWFTLTMTDDVSRMRQADLEAENGL